MQYICSKHPPLNQVVGVSSWQQSALEHLSPFLLCCNVCEWWVCGTSALKLQMIRSLHCSQPQHLSILIEAHFSIAHLVANMFPNLTYFCRICLLSFLHMSIVSVGGEPIQTFLAPEVACTLDMLPLRSRATPLVWPHTGKQHTSIPHMYIVLDCGRKPEYLEKPHAVRGTTLQIPHRRGFDLGTSCCEAAMLTTTQLKHPFPFVCLGMLSKQRII